jgi:hypothetical protein
LIDSGAASISDVPTGGKMAPAWLEGPQVRDAAEFAKLFNQLFKENPPAEPSKFDKCRLDEKYSAVGGVRSKFSP